MDDERKRNPFNANFKYNKKGSKYTNRKLLYIVLIIFIVINLFLIPFRVEENFTNLVNNNNIIENQINSNSNNPPTPPSTQIKQGKKIKNTKNENKINDNTKSDENEYLSDREKMKYINKSTRNFFQKFEMFSLFGFIGIIYALMWHNSHKTDEENNNNSINNTNDNQKEDDKSKLNDKNKYHLLKDYEEDDYYENI